MTYTVALIGARSGSSLKDKNIRPLAGHPLLAYSIKCALKCKNIDDVFVSTDSEQYFEMARLMGGITVVMQPPEVSRDDSGDYPFIAWVLDWMSRHGYGTPDLLAHLRPTTPLRDPATVERAIEAMKADKDATAMRSVHEMSESAYKCFEIDGPWLKTVCTRSYEVDASNGPRHLYQSTYHPNGYVDILRPAFICTHNMLHGFRVAPFRTAPVTEVDTEADFEFLEWQAARHPEIVKALFDEGEI